MSITNINRVTITGGLTADPELSTLASGTSVAKLRVACNARKKTSEGWVDKPNYFTVTLWGVNAENAAKYLSKGSSVAVDGRLEWREWEQQDGKKREAVEIIGENVQYLGSPKTSGKQAEDEALVSDGNVGDDTIPF